MLRVHTGASSSPSHHCSEPLSMAELLALADADAQQRWDSLRLAYTETQGLPALREAVAAVHYSTIRAEQLVVAAPQELVLLTMQASCCRLLCQSGSKSLHQLQLPV